MVGLDWKIPLKWMMTGGTPISGNLHVSFYVSRIGSVNDVNVRQTSLGPGPP